MKKINFQNLSTKTVKIKKYLKSKQAVMLGGFAALVFISILFLPKTNRETASLMPVPTSNQLIDSELNDGGIDALKANLEKIKKEARFNDVTTRYEEMQETKVAFEKSEEEIRQDLLSVVKPVDQVDFEKELSSVFDVGEHKPFFIRQIENCKIKIDLAVVGIAIIRVHEVMNGENPSVKSQDTEEFISYIKEQVQYALSAEDKNYKAIVFKGLESSAG